MNKEEAFARIARMRRALPKDLLLLNGLFDKQKAFYADPAQFKAALCTRRAGKSHVAAVSLYTAALKHPESLSLYVGLTRRSAETILWPVLSRLNVKLELGAEARDSTLDIIMPNKSRIMLVGADQKNFIHRLRGPAYAIAVIDEAQSFREHIRELIDDVLEPALGDLRGQLLLTGTPGPIPDGLFYEATELGQGAYSVHKWSVYDNPFFPDAAGYISDLKRRRGWTDENPTFQREWLGRWVVDRDALVYKFNKDKNCYHSLPEGHDYVRILGVDYGWNDATALAIVTYSHTLRKVYLEHCEGHTEIIPSDIAQRIEQLRERYRPTRIVADTGGLGKSITEEFIRRYHIPIYPAEKKDKLSHIALMNGDFIDGNLFVHESLTPLHDQYKTLVKGDDGMEDPNLPNDLCDAALYAYYQARHYLGVDKEPIYAPNTKQWADKEAKKMFQEDIEAFEKAKNKEWWENS